MRAALAWLVAIALCVTAGCYRSHERSGPPRAGLDAFVPDSAIPPPSCTIRCAPAELVAESAPIGGGEGFIVALVVVDGEPFVLVNTSVVDAVGDVSNAYLPFRAASGELLAPMAPIAPRTHQQLSAATVRDVGGVLRVIGLESGPGDRDHDVDVRVGLAVFSRDGDVVSELEPIATAPFGLSRAWGSNEGAVVGREDRDLALFTQGMAVHAWDIRVGATAEPELVELVALSDDGGQAPVSAALLDDGRIVVAGGGTSRGDAGRTPLARTPFLAIGSITDAPLVPQRIAGLRTDPPPAVVAESPGFALVRYQAEVSDLVRSTIHVMHADSDGVRSSESLVRTRGGVRPVATSAFTSGEHVGIAFTTRAPDSAELDVHVMPPGLDDRCESIEAEPVVRVPEDPTRFFDLVAAPGEDGATYVALFVPTERATRAVRVYRIASCVVER
jgi:hypothetical protein